MRIGVITLYLYNNFGGILQAYALQKVLNNLGHDAILIDKPKYIKYGPVYRRYAKYIRNFILKYLCGKDIPVRPDIENIKIRKTISIHTERFINQYIKRHFSTDYTDITADSYNSIIVGSDQIWKPQYFHLNIEKAFLDFTAGWNIKRISYAASFGTDQWEYTDEQTAHCAELLKKFNAVSVRESSAVELCKEKLCVKAEHVLDPTLLLAKENYIELFKATGTPQSEGNLFCYVLDNNLEKSNIIEIIARERNLNPFYVNSRYEDPNVPLEERIQQPVEKWLRAFYDAEFIITDSFHACVFSIIFNKPFIVSGNKKRGLTRFESLLKMFGLEERLVSSTNEINTVLKKHIDWERVNSIHKRMKEKSLSFLTKNLK